MSTERNQIERLIEVGSKMRRNAPRYPKAKATYSEWDALVAEIKSPWRDSGRKDDDGWPVIEYAEGEGTDLCAVSPEYLGWLLALLRKHAPEGMTKEVER